MPTPLFEAVCDRLRAVELETRHDPVEPFGRPLPLVTGWIVDPGTGLLVFIAECEEEWSDDPWRDLLFAVSGIRHSLAEGRSTGLGAPVVLALVDSAEDEKRLKRLIEVLGRDFVVFSRIDVSLVCAERIQPQGEIDRRELDHALAPLLPVCRAALQSNSRVDLGVLETFQAELGRQIDVSAAPLEAKWGEELEVARRDLRDRLCGAVRVTPESSDELLPFSRVAVQDFRATTELDVQLKPATVVDGLNGTGKSSLFEALEILWSGTSSRKPPGVEDETYQDHLRRGGTEDFRLEGWRRDRPDEPLVRSSLDGSGLSVRRSVLHQDHLRRMVELEDRDRYSWFLEQTGLEVPGLRDLHKRLQNAAFDDLNDLLREMSIAPLKARSHRADSRLDEALRPLDHGELKPDPEALSAQEELDTLLGRHEWRYVRRFVPRVEVEDQLSQFTRLCARAKETLEADPELVDLRESIGNSLRKLHGSLETQAGELSDAVAALGRVSRKAARADDAVELPVPPGAASLWLRAAASIDEQVIGLEGMVDSIPSPAWQERLRGHAERVKAANALAFRQELVELSRAAEKRRSEPTAPSSRTPEIFERAGLVGPGGGSPPPAMREPAERLVRALRSEAERIRAMATSVREHPAPQLAGRERELQTAAARFELARVLEKPIDEAEASILAQVVTETLESVFSELVAALTRFDWHFRRANLGVARNRMAVTNMVTANDKLELRMLLNSGESCVVGLAWFLSLFLLQGSAQRKVLLLDDPFGSLDQNNRAAAVSTLRMLVRLCEPELFMVSTHDEAFGEVLLQELCSFEGWPENSGRLRFTRSPDGSTACEPVVVEDHPVSVETELERLGMATSAPVVDRGS